MQRTILVWNLRAIDVEKYDFSDKLIPCSVCLWRILSLLQSYLQLYASRTARIILSTSCTLLRKLWSYQSSNRNILFKLIILCRTKDNLMNMNYSTSLFSIPLICPRTLTKMIILECMVLQFSRVKDILSVSKYYRCKATINGLLEVHQQTKMSW